MLLLDDLFTNMDYFDPKMVILYVCVTLREIIGILRASHCIIAVNVKRGDNKGIGTLNIHRGPLLLPHIRWRSMTIMVMISKYMIVKQWLVKTNICQNFNGGLTKPLLNKNNLYKTRCNWISTLSSESIYISKRGPSN